MKIRYAPLAVACALMVAPAATTTAQAAAVTYYFGGTLKTSDVPSLPVGNSFAGSFTFESSALESSTFAGDPFRALYVSDSTTIDATLNSYSFSSVNTPACSSSCVGEVVTNDDTTSGDVFQVSNLLLGISAPLTGPNLNGSSPFLLLLNLYDSGSTVFNSDALPASLALSSFDDSVFQIGFFNGATSSYASGPLAYLSATAPIPEASTSTMLAMGLVALGFARSQKNH